MIKKFLFVLCSLVIVQLSVCPMAFAANAQFGSHYTSADDVDICRSDNWVPNNSLNVNSISRQVTTRLLVQTGADSNYCHQLGNNEYYDGSGYHNDFYVQWRDRSGLNQYWGLGSAMSYRGSMVTYDIERWSADFNTNASEWSFVIYNSVGQVMYLDRFQTLGPYIAASAVDTDNQGKCNDAVSSNFVNWNYRKSNGIWVTNSGTQLTSANATTCTSYHGVCSGSGNNVYVSITH